jgi:hypothetical protein
MIRPTLYIIFVLHHPKVNHTHCFILFFLLHHPNDKHTYKHCQCKYFLHCQSILSETFHSIYNDFHCVDTSFTIEICELPSILWTMRSAKRGWLASILLGSVSLLCWTTAGLACFTRQCAAVFSREAEGVASRIMMLLAEIWHNRKSYLESMTDTAAAYYPGSSHEASWMASSPWQRY